MFGVKRDADVGKDLYIHPQCHLFLSTSGMQIKMHIETYVPNHHHVVEGVACERAGADVVPDSAVYSVAVEMLVPLGAVW